MGGLGGLMAARHQEEEEEEETPVHKKVVKKKPWPPKKVLKIPIQSMSKTKNLQEPKICQNPPRCQHLGGGGASQRDTLLDHIWSNNILSHSHAVCQNCGMSDHQLIYVDYFGKDIEAKVLYSSKRRWRNFDGKTYNQLLQEVDWLKDWYSENVSVNVSNYTEKQCEVLNKVALMKRVQLQNNYAVWLTDELKEELKIRDNLKLEAIVTKK